MFINMVVIKYGTMKKIHIGGSYFENRLCKSFNWFAKFEFAGRSIKSIWL